MICGFRRCGVLLGLLGMLFWGVYQINSRQKNLDRKGVRHYEPTFFNLDRIKNLSNITGIAIIGSGCAGSAAAVYAGNLRIPAVVIQGGMPTGLLGQTTDVENWPGEISIMGPNLVEKLHNHAKHIGTKDFIADSVDRIDFSQWPYAIYLSDDRVIHALSVIVATGASPRKLEIDGENTYWGSGVTACAICDARFFKDEDVVVIGGGDSAVEEATILARYAKNVTILVRKDRMRAAEKGQMRIKGYPNISIMHNVEVKAIVGDGTKVTGIEVYNNQTKQVQTLAVSGVFLAIGHEPNSSLVESYINTDDAGYIKMQDRSQETSLPGVFAAGDVEDFVYRQAIVAAASGVKAVMDAQHFLDEIGFDAKVIQMIEKNLYRSSDEDEEDSDTDEIASIENSEQFDSELASTDKIVIVDFYTEECVSCKAMMPMVESYVSSHEEKMRLLKVDAAQADDVAKKYHVSKVPTLLVFKEGELIGRLQNAADKGEIHAFLNQWLEK